MGGQLLLLIRFVLVVGALPHIERVVLLLVVELLVEFKLLVLALATHLVEVGGTGGGLAIAKVEIEVALFCLHFYD